MRRQKRLSFLNSKLINLLLNVAAVSYLPNKRPIMNLNNSKTCRNKIIARKKGCVHTLKSHKMG